MLTRYPVLARRFALVVLAALGSGCAHRAATWREPTVLPTAESRRLLASAVAELADSPLTNGETTADANAELRQRILPRLLREEGLADDQTGDEVGMAVFDTDFGLTFDAAVAPALDTILARSDAKDGSRSRRERVDALFHGVVLDHHGMFFDPSRAERNATHRCIEVLREIVSSSRSPGDAAERIAARFRVVSTDNLGDGTQALWLIKNARRVANHPELLDVFERLAWLEDFGIFGSAFLDQWQNGDFDNDQFGDLVELEFAILENYDRALRRFGLNSSDRFQGLAAADQLAILDQALDGITSALDDRRLRGQRAAKFVASAARVMPVVLARRIASIDASRVEKLRRRGVADPQELMRRLFVFTGGPADPESGVFSAWMAKSIVHDASIQLELTTIPDSVVGERTMFILAVPNGRRVDRDFLHVLDDVNAANAARASERGLTDVNPGRAFGRSSLAVSFPPNAMLLDRDALLDEILVSIGDAELVPLADHDDDHRTPAGQRSGSVADLIAARSQALAELRRR